MALIILVCGMFLGFSLGFATMALLAARGSSFQSEEAEVIGDHLPYAYSPSPKFSPGLEARPQASGAFFVPGP